MIDKTFCEKDGDPVEVYPVWNDEYLKNIRIDGNYLKGIILQSRGKLKGNYYIITPETCTFIGDTTMKNSACNDVHFKMLKFPYKILDRTVFAKDIGEDGKIGMTGLTESIAVVAIDKHGNESKVFIV